MDERTLDDLFRSSPHGLLTANALRRAGVTYDKMLELAQLGVLLRPLHGIYRLADQPRPPLQHLALPLLYLSQRHRPGSRAPRLSGAAALAVRGLWPEGRRIALPLVLVDPDCRARPAGKPFRLRRAAPAGDPDVVEQLAVADPGRSLVDAAGVDLVEEDLLLLAADAIRQARLATLPQLVAAWRRLGGRGGRRLDLLLRDRRIEAESPRERIVLTIFLTHPPVPDLQVVLVGRRRVDFVFLSAGLVIEYYGQDAHRDQVDADAARVHDLKRRGWRVIVVTASMLEDPAGLAAHIHSVRRSREQLIASGALPQPVVPAQPDRVTPLRTLHPLG